MASSANEALGPTKGKQNFQRLTRLLISGGTILLREIFNCKSPPTSLPVILQTYESMLKGSRRLDKKQRDIVFPSAGTFGSSGSFDISLMTSLLELIGGFRPPTSGNWREMPADNAILVSDDIVRLRLYRNNVHAHVQDMEVGDNEFLDQWQNIKEALLRLAGYLGNEYVTEWKVEIDKLLSSPLTLDDELNVEELRRWYDRDVEIRDDLRGIEASLGQVKTTLGQLRDLHLDKECVKTCHKQHHGHKALDHFCHDCREIGCEMCGTMIHRSHRFYKNTSDPVLQGIMKDVGEGIEKAKRKISACDGEMKSVDQEVSLCDKRLQMIEKIIHNYVEKCVDLIRKQEKELVQEIDMIRLHSHVEADNHKARIHGYKEDASRVVGYAEALVQHGHTLEICQEADTVRNNLQELYSYEFLTTPLAAKGQTFAPNSAFLDNLSANGIGRVTSIDPMLCKAEGQGVSNTAKVSAGLQATFTVSTYTVKGERIHAPYEGMTVSVTYKPDDVTSNATAAVTQDVTTSTKDNRDGTLTVTYIPPCVGYCYVAVKFSGAHIPGSPFKVRVCLREYRPVKTIGSKGQGHGDFDGPWSTAVNSSNEVFVTDRFNSRVQVFREDGSYDRTIGEFGSKDGQLVQPRGVAINRHDDVIVTDTGNHRVQIFHKDGTFKFKFGGAGDAPGRLQSPYGVTLDERENMVISDLNNQRVQVFSPTGELIRVIGRGNHGPGKIIKSYYCIAHRNRYIVSDSGDNCIKIFDIEGNYVDKFGKAGKKDGAFNHLRGLAIDKCGNLLVCDSWNDRIQIFRPAGRSFVFAGKFGSEGERLGKFKQPTTVTVLNDGRLIVCEFHNSRVHEFT